MRKFIFIFSFLCFVFQLKAQTDSCRIQISLLTCTPGQELYSTFGHSAFRVIDRIANTDLIFNYGTFDFNDPDFYKKFIRGKLLYFVSVDSLEDFLYEYRYYKRGVTEQVLNLTCEEKQNLMAALYENAKEENKYYLYNFNYDNCSSRLRDMVEKIAGQQMVTKNILPHPSTTFRDLIHDYLDKGGQQWSKLGIDILLGSPLDIKITNREAMFLPDYLMYAFDSSVLNNKPLVENKNILIPEFAETKTRSFFTPFVVSLILFLLIAAVSYIGIGRWKLFFKIFDFILFLKLGLLGALLVFMWLGTDHAMCKNNFNLLWALPFHLPISFFIFSKKEWVRSYFRFIFFYSLALVIAWFFLPQQMNPALFPVVGIVIARSYFLGRN